MQWTLTFDSKAAAPGSHVLAKFIGSIQPGWHVYSMTTPPGGPNPTTASIASNPAVAGFKIYQLKPERKLDPNFGIDTETFAGQYVLLYDIELKKDAAAGPADITVNVRYQCCNDTICLPPKKKSATASITIDPSAKSAAIAIPSGYDLVPAESPRQGRLRRLSLNRHLHNPRTSASSCSLLSPPDSQRFSHPCVFPMIPFTVSYFVNRQSGTKRDGVLQAAGLLPRASSSVYRARRAG